MHSTLNLHEPPAAGCRRGTPAAVSREPGSVQPIGRRIGFCLLMGASVWLLAGCFPVSVFPFYQSSNVVQDPALLGTWKGEPDKEEGWTFAPGEDQAYQLTIREEDGVSRMQAALFKLGNQRFLDLYAASSELEPVKTPGVYYKVALIPGHLLFRVDQIEPALQMRAFSLEWLRNYLKDNPTALSHRVVVEEGKDARVILTAPTPALQAFILRHLDNTNAWSELETMERTRPLVKDQ